MLENSTLRLELDSTNAVADLGGFVPMWPNTITGGSNKPDLQRLVVSILNKCARSAITLDVHWQPRDQNTRADNLSRAFETDAHYDFLLKPALFALVEREFGVVHEVDRFASGSYNCLVTTGKFNSRFFSGDAGFEWSDALSGDWSGRENWVHPYALINHVIDHFKRCKAKGTLIIPAWPTASWWPRIFGPNPAPWVLRVLPLGASQDALEYVSKNAAFAQQARFQAHGPIVYDAGL